MAAPTPGLPCGLYMGKDSGHGICIPLAIHATVPCGTPCPAVPKKPLAAMNATAMWLPFAQLPLNIMQAVVNVVVNGQIPITDQDLLVNHPSPKCTQLVVYTCNSPPKPKPCPVATLCAEDAAGGGAHIRKATATTKSVFINGRRVCRTADPLGPPCLSLIATGAVNVLIGV